MAYHEGLKSTRDDAFFKLCKMHGVAFDGKQGVGTLFFLTDSIGSSGCVSFMSVATSRKRAIEKAMSVSLFLSQQFGKSGKASSSGGAEIAPLWDNVSSIHLRLKHYMKDTLKNV